MATPPTRPCSLRLLPALAALALAATGCGASFDLSVGAFEVGQREVILWTHVTPDDPDAYALGLLVEVATDPDLQNLVRLQPAVATMENDFTVRAKIRHLQPGTQYYYRFVVAGDSFFWPRTSPVGSFRTAPADNSAEPVRFVISGDSNLGYTAPRGLDFYVLSAAAAENPDFFLYFGDTIYADSGILPTGDATTLDEYREVHRLTRADPHLQTLIASTGTFSGWDDHEVYNDYDGETVDPARFEAGARAFFEYLPLRLYPRRGPRITHRRVRWGEHVELFFIDGRQYRDAELFCNATSPDGPLAADTLFSPFEEDEMIATAIDPFLGPMAADLLLTPSDPDCMAGLLADPNRSMLGPEQLAWLKASLLDSTATFKIIVNDVPISSILVTPYDRWEGYPAERDDLLAFIEAELDPRHVLVLATDFHTNMAIERSELTEVVIGPIGMSTFATSVKGLLPPSLAPFINVVLDLFDGVLDIANGPPQTPPLLPTGSLLNSEHDAFSYAVVDVYEDAGGTPRLSLTVRGDPDYAAGANDPGLVQDLFTVELP